MEDDRAKSQRGEPFQVRPLKSHRETGLSFATRGSAVYRRESLLCGGGTRLHCLTNPHVLPIVIKFLPAIETGDVCAAAGGIHQLRPARWGYRKGRSLMSATEQGI